MSREILLKLSPDLKQLLNSISFTEKIDTYQIINSTVNRLFSEYSRLLSHLSVPPVFRVLLLEGNLIWIRKDSLKSYHFLLFLSSLVLNKSPFRLVSLLLPYLHYFTSVFIFHALIFTAILVSSKTLAQALYPIYKSCY